MIVTSNCIFGQLSFEHNINQGKQNHRLSFDLVVHMSGDIAVRVQPVN